MNNAFKILHIGSKCNPFIVLLESGPVLLHSAKKPGHYTNDRIFWSVYYWGYKCSVFLFRFSNYNWLCKKTAWKKIYIGMMMMILLYSFRLCSLCLVINDDRWVHSSRNAPKEWIPSLCIQLAFLFFTQVAPIVSY